MKKRFRFAKLAPLVAAAAIPVLASSCFTHDEAPKTVVKPEAEVESFITGSRYYVDPAIGFGDPAR